MEIHRCSPLYQQGIDLGRVKYDFSCHIIRSYRDFVTNVNDMIEFWTNLVPCQSFYSYRSFAFDPVIQITLKRKIRIELVWWWVWWPPPFLKIISLISSTAIRIKTFQNHFLRHVSCFLASTWWYNKKVGIYRAEYGIRHINTKHRV